MVQEGGKTTDDFLTIKGFGNFKKSLPLEANGIGTGPPRIFGDFFGGELFLDREEDLPLVGIEFDWRGGGHFRGRIGPGAGLHRFAADVSHPEGEDAIRGHEDELLGTGDAAEDFGVFFEGLALGHL